jgi:hypothetical protein
VARYRKTEIFKMELMTKICVNYQHFKHAIGFVHNTSARKIFEFELCEKSLGVSRFRS